MALALLIAQNLLFIAALAMVLQWVVGLFSWRNRHANPVYLMLSFVTAPAYRVVRAILPRGVAEARVPQLAFVLAAVGYLGLGFAHRDVCLPDLSQAGCGKWLAARSRVPG